MNAISSSAGASTAFMGLDVGIGQGQRLNEVAQQMEGLFVSMLLKSMRETMASEMFSGDGADIWGGLFDQQMGEQIARDGGLGLVEQLQPQRLSVSA